MQKRLLGRTGLSVSALGFGSAPIGLLETEQQRVGTILHELLDAGVNLIDTAAAYAGSEEAIGQTVGHRRAEFAVQGFTRAWSRDLGPHGITVNNVQPAVIQVDALMVITMPPRRSS